MRRKEIAGFDKKIKLSLKSKGKGFSISFKGKKMFSWGNFSINDKSFRNKKVSSWKTAKGKDGLGIYRLLTLG